MPRLVETLARACMAMAVLFAGGACRPTSGEEPEHSEARPEAAAPWISYSGLSDASAAVAIDADRILVADDETNVLRLYAIGGGAPLASHDMAPFLASSVQNPEADLEGGARVGDRIYWIASHGRSKSGKQRPNRQVFFATDLVQSENGAFAFRAAGAPVRGLVQAMVAEPALATLDLGRAYRVDDAGLGDDERRRLAPQREGLNVEGLSASPTPGRLYIGLRNPLAHDAAGPARAIVIPLENAAEVVERRAAPRFGAPVLLDLSGGGIRGMAWSAERERYFIVSGPPDEEGTFGLWGWSGAGDPELLDSFAAQSTEWKPEAIVDVPGATELLVLSDDGTLRLPTPLAACSEGWRKKDGTCENKRLRDPAARSFRGSWIPPRAPGAR